MNLLEKFQNCFCNQDDYKHVENKGSFFTVREGVKLTIYFEKSNGLVDWLNNFDFLPENRNTGARATLKSFFGWVKGLIFNLRLPKKAYKDTPIKWYCHGGFLKVWKSIEPYLQDEINNPMIREFEVIGYSHGGAVAQLCFEYIKYWRPDCKVTGYGFGAPRIIWGKPADFIKHRFDGFTIIRNQKDIVTHLPPKLFGFTDVCKILVLKGYPKSRGVIKDHYPENYWVALHNIEEDEEAV